MTLACRGLKHLLGHLSLIHYPSSYALLYFSGFSVAHYAQTALSAIFEYDNNNKNLTNQHAK